MWNLLDFQYIQVTAEYSNAVLLAVLPHIAVFAHALELQIPSPLPVEAVEKFGCNNRLGDAGGFLQLTNGDVFTYLHGHVASFHTRNSLRNLSDFRLVPSLFGTNRLSREEATVLCRRVIRKLGYTEEQLYADLEPAVRSPGKRSSTNTIPRFEIEWVDPRDGISCTFEVNSQNARIESISFFSRALWRAPPRINVSPTPAPGQHFRSRFQPLNATYSAALVPALMPIINKFSRAWSLPVMAPVTTNHIGSAICGTFDGEIYCYVTLTNGHSFFLRHGMVEAYDAPDAFFNPTVVAPAIKDFQGEWHLSQAEAIECARGALKRLGFDLETLGAHRKPEVSRPRIVTSVPRYQLDWVRSRGGVLLSHVLMEVDGQTGSVKSFNIFDPELAGTMPSVGLMPEATEEWLVPPPGFPPWAGRAGRPTK